MALHTRPPRPPSAAQKIPKAPLPSAKATMLFAGPTVRERMIRSALKPRIQYALARCHGARFGVRNLDHDGMSRSVGDATLSRCSCPGRKENRCLDGCEPLIGQHLDASISGTAPPGVH